MRPVPSIGDTSDESLSSFSSAELPTTSRLASINFSRSNASNQTNTRGRPSNNTRAAQRRKQLRPVCRQVGVLKEIKKLRASTELLIPRLPFSRVIREVMSECTVEVNRITKEALEAIQESTEMYLVNLLEDAYLLTLHRQRVTLSKQDLRLLEILRHYR